MSPHAAAFAAPSALASSGAARSSATPSSAASATASPPVAASRHVATAVAERQLAVTAGPGDAPPGAEAHAAPGTSSRGGHRSGLDAERELVAKAREALLAHDFPAAVAALDRHARRFPAGQLAEERDSLRVRVTAARGDSDRARALAADFARRHPGSLFLPSVQAAIQ
jgi:hypothetical protein